MAATKNIRLTKAIRSDIVSNICNTLKGNLIKNLGLVTEDDVLQRLKVLEKEALIACWVEKYGKNLEHIQKVSRDLLSPREFVLFCSDRSAKHEMREYPYIGKQMSGYDVILTGEEYDEKFASYLELLKDWNNVKAEVNSVVAEARVIIESVNTTKQLIEIWATAENYIPAHIADPDKGSKLPSKLVSDLDERIKSLGI